MTYRVAWLFRQKEGRALSNPLTMKAGPGRNVSPVTAQKRTYPIGSVPAGITDTSVRDAATVMAQQRNWRTGQRTGPKFLQERVDQEQRRNFERMYGDLVTTSPSKRGK